VDQSDAVIAEAYQEGLSHHHAGRLAEAEACYRRALASNPAHAPALHLLGVVALQVGRHDIAVETIGKAIELQPLVADYHSNLGNALAALGRLGEAEGCFREALRLNPKAPVTQNNLGNVLRDQGRLAEAEASYRSALRLDAAYAAAHNNLGNTLRDLGRLDEAVAVCRTALGLQPDYAEAHNNLGNALNDQGETAEAEACFRAALHLKPDYAEGHNNLALVLRDGRRFAEAEACCRAALRIAPTYAEAHNNLGAVLRSLGRLDEALLCQETAIRLKPDFPLAYVDFGNVLQDIGQFEAAEASCRAALRLRLDYPEAQVSLGLALMALGRPAEAEGCYRAALDLKPVFPEARFNLSLLLLLAGRLDEGWREYEGRWEVRADGFIIPRGFAQPRWGGEALGDRVLLVHAEQGYGDTLQFCRYLPAVAERGRVVVEVPRALVRLVSALPGVQEVVASGDPLPAFDVYCPMLSLPAVFGTTLETIPAAVPYLAAEPASVAMWRERLAVLPGLRVGLVWAGDARRHLTGPPTVDRRRSLMLEQLAPLVGIDGVSFVSLQKGEPAAQARPDGLVLHDWTNELGDFADTAGLVEALDLVISVDTAVAHLVGALGKPVWLLNRYDTCWRWLLNRDDSPWYPSLRQFRQTKPGEWGAVLDAVRTALVARSGAA